ncbi:rho-related BTB domain-containing protein 3 [Bubalus bubalis]|uniref:rho-related BTB domain-containing protein 3 n=1 Tax=Bubalus bubalis TaxID=89462 RepID=UPI001D126BA6|nr:rho-related BTB domain-containing protein 3 [Bubalus bubalis]
MLTNDQAADLVKTLLVKAKKRGSEKKKKKGCWSGHGAGFPGFPYLFFSPLVFREQGPQPPHHHTPPPPTPFPGSAPVTAFRVEQTCCRRIGDQELSGRGVVFINLYSAAPRAGRSFVSGPPPPPLPGLGGEPQRGARPLRPPEDTPPPPPPRPARAAAARPAERGGGPASPPPAAEPEARGAAAGRPAGKARRPASLRGGGCGGPAAGTAGPPAPGCAPALPDWLAARTRPPELARPPALRRPRRAGGARGGGDAARDELIAGGRAWWWWGAETTPPPGPPQAARSRPFSASPPGPGGLEIMSIHIVALGNEGDAFHQDSRPSGLIRAYLGRSPLVSGDESSLLLSASGAAARPVFTEYQASAFGNVKLVVHDCPVWDIFDSDWYTSRNLIGGADIIVIKYNVNDKFSFHEVKDNYIPVIKRALNSVPVIIAAVGTRQNEELPCTCPLCTSDRGSCVSTTEGIQLAKELGATYLELHSLDDFYIGKYFGGVLEYFMIQALNQKTSEKMKRRKMSNSFHGIRPPQLEQPEKMPVLKAEASHYNADLNNLLFCCQCVDVVFYSPDLKEVAEAHKIVLCAVSHVFMLLFSVKSPADIQDSSIIQTTQDLFTINRDPAFPGASQESPGNPPLRVIVKDAFFCSCLSDILRFIYSGAFQWEELEDDIRKKLKDSGDVSNVIERVKCILKTPGKFNCLRNCKTYQARKPLWFYNTSLKFFLNKPMLADVVFEIQGTTVPAHRAILVARCEVMAAMFNGNYMEAKSVLIPVYGVSKETFLSFLEYLYTDSCCPAGIFQAMCLLICAEMYQVSRLQHICELFIITQLQSMPSRELASMNLDIVDLLKKAKFHHSDCLSTWLLHFIATNYLIFSQKPEFQDLSVEERSFVEKHRWPSTMYLKQLAEYRKYIHSRKCRCLVM